MELHFVTTLQFRYIYLLLAHQSPVDANKQKQWNALLLRNHQRHSEM